MIASKPARKNHFLVLSLVLSLSLLLTACQQNGELRDSLASGKVGPSTLFRDDFSTVPFEQRSRRKWDNAVVADLDGDGGLDLIVVEHGYRIRIFWRDKGRYSAPQDIAFGDLHGVAVSDLDNDGRMDLLIAQGGGDGANPRRPLWFQVNKDRTLDGGSAFDYFEPGRGRATKFLDADNDGELELVVTGFPLASQTKGANHLYENLGKGRFKFMGHLPRAKWLGYRATTAEVTNDGDIDLLIYGGDNLLLLKGGQGSTFSDATDSLLGSLTNISDVSSVSELDYDNDGDLDLFLTRSEAQFDQETYYDAEAQRFAFLVFRRDFQFDDLQIDGNLTMENLQVTYPHYDVFVGDNKRQLTMNHEDNGNQDFTLRPEEAVGWPTGPLKAGLYIGYLGDGLWRVGGEVRSRTAGVIHNVVSAPTTTPQEQLPARLWENRGDHFVDVTEDAGIVIDEQTTSAAAADFDNNGWVDLAVLRYGDMALENDHIVYLNQGDGRFHRAEGHGLASYHVGTTGGSVEAVDLDEDGRVDLIYSNERGRWHLMTNVSTAAEANQYLLVNVGRSPSGKASPLGAKLTANACGVSHRRTVGTTSAAFSQGLNTYLHVGLGSCGQRFTVSVEWTNGEVQRLADVQSNSQVRVGQK